MYQKLVIKLFACAAVIGIVAADSSFEGTLPSSAARILTAFEGEVEEGVTGHEVDETVAALRAAGANGTLHWPGGSADV